MICVIWWMVDQSENGFERVDPYVKPLDSLVGWLEPGVLLPDEPPRVVLDQMYRLVDIQLCQ